ncbi:MAG: hypothetical protein MPJ24_09875 [Pirellulaceae bacterium]|nr:hypothetical protein [Pirellulaceae bacterium]
MDIAIKNAELEGEVCSCGKLWWPGVGNPDYLWYPKDISSYDAYITGKIYMYYGKTFNKAPRRFLWMGLGTRAGTIVNKTLFNLPDDIEKVMIFAGRSGSIATEDAWKTFAQLKFLQRELPKMAKAIFFDLAWQHELYLACGLPGIKATYEAGKLSKKEYNSWKNVDGHIMGELKIEWGDYWLLYYDGGHKNVFKGAEEMAYHEQNVILAPFYKKWRENPTGSWYSYSVSEFASIYADVGIRGARSFLGWKPGGNIANDEHRWHWIKRNVLWAWGNLTHEERVESSKKDMEALKRRVDYLKDKLKCDLK